MKDSAKEERASIRRVHKLIDWLCDEPKMPRRGRYVYKPAQVGWVVTRDMTHELVHSIDCSGGGAQQALEHRCAELKADGWTLEKRFADSLFANRATKRVRITIEAFDPAKPPPLGQSTGDFSEPQ